jgi:predicted PurR-regulated permease PerM
MTEQSNSQQGIRFLVIAAALVIILMGINQAQSVLVSFLVAIFFAIIGTPPVLWLQRKRIPSIVAVLLVVSGMITILLIVVNFILDNVIETRLMGQRLGLSTLVVFLSLIFWGSLLGPVGMVLCIPLTMTLKFACENNKGTQWLAVLLGPAPTESIPPVSKKGGNK